VKAAKLEPKPEAAPPKAKGFKVRAEAKSTARRSLTLRLAENGAPEWNKLSEPTKEAWREILNRPETKTGLGVSPLGDVGPQQQQPEFVSWGAVKAAYTVLGQVESRIFAKIYKVPVQIAEQIFCFRTQELQLLTPPTQKILSKYAPEFLSKYGDEIGLVLLLASMTQAKVSTCAAIGKKIAGESESKEETVKPNGHSKTSQAETGELPDSEEIGNE